MHRIASCAAAATVALGALAVTTPAHTAPAAARTYTVTAKANLTEAVAKEDTVTVRGRVTPKAAGEKVLLQQRVGTKKKWTLTDNARIKRNGTYVLSDRPSTPGAREYRVVKPASDGIRQGISKSLGVQVYRWEKLVRRTEGPRTNLATTGVLIGAEYFDRSLATTVAGSPSSIEYTLGLRCTQLRATYALTDASATGATGAVTLTGDGAVLASHALAVGTVVADEVVDVSDVFRVKLDLTTSATPAAVAAVATPEVLCTR